MILPEILPVTSTPRKGIRNCFSSSSFTLRIRYMEFHSNSTNEDILMKGLLTEVWARLKEPTQHVEIPKTSKNTEWLRRGKERE